MTELREGEPINNGATVFHKDAEEAVRSLRYGCIVDWQPGDGARYECALVKQINGGHRYWLLVLNGELRSFFEIGKSWDAISYCVTRGAPVGGWFALRPLLAALGAADGEPVLNLYDKRRESDLRAHNYDGEPLNHKDARLGRALRRLVQDQEGEVKP